MQQSPKYLRVEKANRSWSYVLEGKAQELSNLTVSALSNLGPIVNHTQLLLVLTTENGPTKPHPLHNPLSLLLKLLSGFATNFPLAHACLLWLSSIKSLLKCVPMDPVVGQFCVSLSPE
jgi:hypothetical protein